jgi:hypothetical protein
VVPQIPDCHLYHEPHCITRDTVLEATSAYLADRFSAGAGGEGLAAFQRPMSCGSSRNASCGVSGRIMRKWR